MGRLAGFGADEMIQKLRQAGFAMVHVIARRAATKQSLKGGLLRFARNDKEFGRSKRTRWVYGFR